VSTVDAAVDALRAKIATAVGPDVEVYDGPGTDDRSSALRAVTIAAAFEDDQDAIAVTRAYSGAKPRFIETLDVACSIYAGSGDSDPGAVDSLRGDASVILAGIDYALRKDRTLGGKVGQARLTSARWVQGRDAAGAGVYVGLIVSLVQIGPDKPAAGLAIAAVPGYYEPLGALLPANLAALEPVTPQPLFAWAPGQYVPLADGSSAHWSGTAWVAGPAPSSLPGGGRF
jgi:hypothetical protein